MKDHHGGAFSLDLLLAWGLLLTVMVPAVLLALGTMSWRYTDQYATDLHSLAGSVGDMLVKSPGSPPGWHGSPTLARGAAGIGLCDGPSCILSTEKVYSLNFFNASAISRHLNLDDSENTYGVRIEVSADDGSIFVASGYLVDDGTLDVCKSVRLVVLRGPEGVEKNGKLIVYLWRERAGSRAADF